MNLKKTSKISNYSPYDGYMFFRSGVAWSGLPDLQSGIFAENFIGTGSMPVDALYKIVQKLGKNDEILIEGYKDGVKIETTKGTFNFPFIDHCEFTKCEYTEGESEVLIENFTDINKLQTAKKFVSKDEMRQAMLSIYLSEKQLAATDAHRLYYPGVSYEFINPKRPECNNQFRNDPHILIDPMAVDIFKNNTSFEISTNKSYIHYRTRGKFFTHRRNDSIFPNFQGVIPHDQQNEFTCDVKKLPELIDLALLAANEQTNQVVFSVNGKVEISSECLDYERKYSVNLPVKSINSSEMSIGMNGKLLNEILKEIKGNATFRYRTPNRAITINDEFLIMPIMIK